MDNDETCSDGGGTTDFEVETEVGPYSRLVATDRHSVTIVLGSHWIRTCRAIVAIVTAGEEVVWRY